MKAFLMLFVFFWAGVFSLSSCFSGFSGTKYNTVHWKTYYKDQLAPGSTIISAGPIQTVEYLNGIYLVKNYFFDTKLITSRESFLDANLTKRTGKSVSFSDNGQMITDLTYVNQKLEGDAFYYDDETGKLTCQTHFQMGKKHGTESTYDRNGILLMTAKYQLDSLDGEKTIYSPDGSVKRVETYKNGELISGGVEKVAGDSIQVTPSFPCTEAYSTQAKCDEVSLQNFLAKNIRYPSDAREYNIQGTAMVKFIIAKDGAVTDISVPHGLCNSIAKECERVVSLMPKWKPGMYDGKPARVKFTLPVRFKLI